MKNLYDTIHKFKDFKRMLIHGHNNKIDFRELRTTILEKTINEMLIEVNVILTIPSNEGYILRHFVGKRYFNRLFCKDKTFDEYKEYKKFIEDCMKKIKDEFGDVIEGYWSNE